MPFKAYLFGCGYTPSIGIIIFTSVNLLAIGNNQKTIKDFLVKVCWGVLNISYKGKN